MTAVNVIRQKNAIYVFTDGASWIPGGGFGPPCNKAWPLPHLNAAVALRGPGVLGPIVAHAVAAAGSTYDQMKGRVTAVVREVVGLYAEMTKLAFGGDQFEVVIAGWSAQGPDSFVFRSCDVPAVSAWSIEQCGPVMMAPGDATIQAAALAALPQDVRSPDDIVPARDGITIMQAQRRIATQRDNAEGMAQLGNFIQMTEVLRSSITSSIIHQWPGEVQTLPTKNGQA